MAQANVQANVQVIALFYVALFRLMAS